MPISSKIPPKDCPVRTWLDYKPLNVRIILNSPVKQQGDKKIQMSSRQGLQALGNMLQYPLHPDNGSNPIREAKYYYTGVLIKNHTFDETGQNLQIYPSIGPCYILFYI